MGFYAGCGRQADILEDHERICTDHCKKVLECDPDAQYPSVEECVTDCNTPNDGLWRTEECDELAEENLACTSSLSCEEYKVHLEDLDNSPCHEETFEFSVCFAQHPKK